MRIEHIALYTKAPHQLVDFYKKYFSARSGEMYHNPKTGLRTWFLSFEEGARLEIMTRPEVPEERGSIYRPGYIHLAVSVGSRKDVDEVTRRLEKDGFTVFSHPRVTGDGYYESVILDPDGNFVEITV